MAVSSEHLRVSVVTPSYNQVKFLEETIRSVLSQDYPNLEYIIIDGGSTDGSVDIIRKYGDRLGYWESEPDRGQAHAINKGLARASGDILCWINSDDLLTPGTLHSVSGRFSSNPDTSWCTGQCQSIEEDGTPRKLLSVDIDGPLSEWLVHMRYNRAAILQPSTFWSRRAWEQVGPLREDLHYAFDFEFFYRLRKKAGSPEWLDAALSKFRLHGESKTVSKKELFLLEMIAVVRSEVNGLADKEREVARQWLMDVRANECFIEQQRALRSGNYIKHWQWRMRGWACKSASS